MSFKHGKIPEALQGRGTWSIFGDECLFVPFNGPPVALNSNWKCGVCDFKWYIDNVKKEHKEHCPVCDAEMSVKFDIECMNELFED